MPRTPSIAIFGSSVQAHDPGIRGALVVNTNLANQWAESGLAVDFLMFAATDAAPKMPLHPEVRVWRLPPHGRGRQFMRLWIYLHRERPRALLTSSRRAGVLSSLALGLLPGNTTAFWPVIHSHFSSDMDGARPARLRRIRGEWRRIARAARGVIAVSAGVAEDFTRITQARVETVYNPIVTPELIARAEEPLTHSWLDPGAPHLLLGLGRLTRQKDFHTLLRAFARVRAARDCRLIVLGEGEDRAGLEALSRELGIEHAVLLPGFVSNPMPWLARASMLVLSSRWEGLPTTLIEALAVGTPVVSTDCPSGPREILEDGRLGPLVPVGEPAALADAILASLDAPMARDSLRAAACRFTAEAAARRYLQVMGYAADASGHA